MAREELRKTRDTVVQFVREYRNKPEGENNVDWLTRQFGRYPDLWSTSADCRRDAGEIVDAVEKFQKDRQELEEHLESGNSVEKYIVSKIDERVKDAIETTVENCMKEPEEALADACRDRLERIQKGPWGGIDLDPLKPPVKGKDMEPGSWRDIKKLYTARSIGRSAVVTGVANAVYQGVRIMGRRIWNTVTGRENQSVEEDLKEYAASTIGSPTGSGMLIAVSGGMTVAVKKGWLGNAVKNTPVGWIANAVCIGFENMKTFWKCGTGEITAEQAVENVAKTTLSFVGGTIAGVKGSAVGAAIGTVLGPVGTAIGGIAGGIVGGIAGSSVVNTLCNGAKKLVSAATGVVKNLAKGTWNAARSVGSSIAGAIRSVLSIF